jgi:hypothetical protein
MNLSKQAKWTRVSNAVAAGTSEIDSAVINMSDFEGVVFAVAFGTITSGAATTVKLQQSLVGDGTGMSDIAGSHITVADTADNTLVLSDLFQVDSTAGGYLRCVVTRATQNAVVDSITAIQYQPRNKPPVQDATTVSSTLFLQSPALGTA